MIWYNIAFLLIPTYHIYIYVLAEISCKILLKMYISKGGNLDIFQVTLRNFSTKFKNIKFNSILGITTEWVLVLSPNATIFPIILRYFWDIFKIKRYWQRYDIDIYLSNLGRYRYDIISQGSSRYGIWYDISKYGIFANTGLYKLNQVHIFLQNSILNWNFALWLLYHYTPWISLLFPWIS